MTNCNYIYCYNILYIFARTSEGEKKTAASQKKQQSVKNHTEGLPVPKNGRKVILWTTQSVLADP